MRLETLRMRIELPQMEMETGVRSGIQMGTMARETGM